MLFQFKSVKFWWNCTYNFYRNNWINRQVCRIEKYFKQVELTNCISLTNIVIKLSNQHAQTIINLATISILIFNQKSCAKCHKMSFIKWFYVIFKSKCIARNRIGVFWMIYFRQCMIRKNSPNNQMKLLNMKTCIVKYKIPFKLNIRIVCVCHMPHGVTVKWKTTNENNRLTSETITILMGNSNNWIEKP